MVERKCLGCGMDDIVPKPMKKDALERMLSEHDRRKRIVANLSNAPQTVSPMSEPRREVISQMNYENNLQNNKNS